jgi:nucleoside-diphosphate-sugar epimerase
VSDGIKATQQNAVPQSLVETDATRRDVAQSTKSVRPLNPADLDHIASTVERLHPGAIDDLRGQRLFLTGGTGFFGCWLLESFLHLNRTLNLQARVTVLTRSATRFQVKAPHLTLDPAVTLLEGDVREPIRLDCPHRFFLHAATDSGGQQAERSAAYLLETIVDGTRNVLNAALAHGTERLLFTSSGAVYGRQPADLTHLPETYLGGPDPMLLSSGYGEAKRMAEQMCIAYAEGSPLRCTAARCFAFVGPHLPLDQHFAIGNFIQSSMAGLPLRITGDGTPRRSYLYAADLVVWLWVLLLRGEHAAVYNVGSEEDLSIAELARTVAETLRSGLPVEVLGTPVPGASPSRYVPSTARARDRLGLAQWITLPDAVRRTAAWHTAAGR